MTDPRPPRLTAIVLTHNRRDEVLLTLARLLALPDAPPVVLVDNASCDGTAEAVQARFPRVEVVRSPTNLGAAGRNLGAERARTPYIAFSDDDTEWQAGSLSRAATLLDTFPAVGLLCARVRVGAAPGVPEADDSTSTLMARSPMRADGLPGRPVLGFMAGACVMRRDLFVAMGGYRREFFVGGEEALLALDLAAARWLMLYCAELVVIHRPSRLRDAGGRRWQLARNRIWVAWMRLPLRDALRETVAGLADFARAGRLLRGAFDTWRHGGFARAERRVLPADVLRDWKRVERMREHVERQTRLAEAARRASPAAISAQRACDDVIERMRADAGGAAPRTEPDRAAGKQQSGNLRP